MAAMVDSTIVAVVAVMVVMVLLMALWRHGQGALYVHYPPCTFHCACHSAMCAVGRDDMVLSNCLKQTFTPRILCRLLFTSLSGMAPHMSTPVKKAVQMVSHHHHIPMQLCVPINTRRL